jgi:ferredoxin
VAISGIEKIVPTLEDVATLMRLLPRSATGQSISNYVDLLTGTKGDGEFHGAEHMYFILVDSGRTSVLASDVREALRCIRCGACMNHCPVYQNVGGHSYGWVYPGPIGSILTPMYVGLENAQDLPAASTFCNQCGVVCPVKIPLPDLQRKLRDAAFERGLRPWRERAGLRLWAWVARHPLAVRHHVGARGTRAPGNGRTRRHDSPVAVRRRLDGRARHAGARRSHLSRTLSHAPRQGRPMNAPHGNSISIPRLSRRGEALGTENAFVVLAEVNALIKQGRDIVSFCIGQPDFPTPVHVQDAAIAAIRAGKHGYTPSAGIDELRAAAAADIGKRRKLDIRPDDVVVGGGAKPFIAYTIASVTDYGAGDEVIYPVPGFPDLRIADRRQWRGAGADLPARIARLCVRSRRTRGAHHRQDAALDPQYAAQSDRAESCAARTSMRSPRSCSDIRKCGCSRTRSIPGSRTTARSIRLRRGRVCSSGRSSATARRRPGR